MKALIIAALLCAPASAQQLFQPYILGAGQPSSPRYYSTWNRSSYQHSYRPSYSSRSYSRGYGTYGGHQGGFAPAPRMSNYEMGIFARDLDMAQWMNSTGPYTPKSMKP